MKKTILITVLVLVSVLFLGCTEENEIHSLVGTWENPQEGFYAEWTFTEDGILTASTLYYMESSPRIRSGTYLIDGNKFIFNGTTESGEEINQEVFFTIEGDSLKTTTITDYGTFEYIYTRKK